MKQDKQRKIRGIKVEEPTYSLYRNFETGEWVIFKTVILKGDELGGLSFKLIFKGTEKECKQKIRELKD